MNNPDSSKVVYTSMTDLTFRTLQGALQEIPVSRHVGVPILRRSGTQLPVATGDSERAHKDLQFPEPSDWL
jgi:hypothetical protein